MRSSHFLQCWLHCWPGSGIANVCFGFFGFKTSAAKAKTGILVEKQKLRELIQMPSAIQPCKYVWLWFDGQTLLTGGRGSGWVVQEVLCFVVKMKKTFFRGLPLENIIQHMAKEGSSVYSALMRFWHKCVLWKKCVSLRCSADSGGGGLLNEIHIEKSLNKWHVLTRLRQILGHPFIV